MPSNKYNGAAHFRQLSYLMVHPSQVARHYIKHYSAWALLVVWPLFYKIYSTDPGAAPFSPNMANPSFKSIWVFVSNPRDYKAA